MDRRQGDGCLLERCINAGHLLKSICVGEQLFDICVTKRGQFMATAGSNGYAEGRLVGVCYVVDLLLVPFVNQPRCRCLHLLPRCVVVRAVQDLSILTVYDAHGPALRSILFSSDENWLVAGMLSRGLRIKSVHIPYIFDGCCSLQAWTGDR
jgi:hypothetical protein